MQNSDWLERWQHGQTGWHQAAGNTALRKFWPDLPAGKRVLVPLCGKSPDLIWLSEKGYEVTGVELSEIACRAVFEEAGIAFETHKVGGLRWFRNKERQLSTVCGDYFEFSDQPYDALYDRAALVALPPDVRPAYVQHTNSLLKADASQLLLALEYDQSMVNGPPYSVMPDEVLGYWPGLHRAGDIDDTKNNPPKFHEAGISKLVEAVWVRA